jgi:xylulokinase
LVEGYFTSLAYVTTSGSVVNWYREKLCPGHSADELMKSLPEGPSRLFIFPYFAGTGTPWLDVAQTGMIFGLSLDTNAAEILKAILEGISYEIRLNLESLREASIPIDVLRATGGGARSDAWMQMKADITGVPIERVSVTEAGCLGAAFLAGLGTGRFSSLEEITSLVKVDRVFEPRGSMRRMYESLYGTYSSVRRRIEGLDLQNIATSS